MTDNELSQLADDILEGRVFTTQSQDESVQAFRLVLFFLEDKACDKIAADKPQMLYEYYDKAMSRSTYGGPMFSSMRWIGAEEWPKFYGIYEAKRSKKGNV